MKGIRKLFCILLVLCFACGNTAPAGYALSVKKPVTPQGVTGTTAVGQNLHSIDSVQ